MKLPFGTVLAEREFRLLISARLISQLGNQASIAVIGFAVLGIGGGAGAIGAVLGASSVSLAVFLIVGGVLGDRWSRRMIMVVADLVRFGSQGLTAVLLVTGHALVWHLVVLQVVAGAASAFYVPAVTAIGVEATASEHRKEANSLRSLVIAVSTIAGPAIGGLFAVLLGPGQALAIDAVSFLVSAMFLTRMKIGAKPVSSGQRIIEQAKAGWSEFRSRTWLWSVTTLASFCSMLVLAPVMVLGPIIAQRDLGGVGAWAMVLSGLGVGAVVGGIAVNWVHPQRQLVWVVAGALLLLPVAVLLGAGVPLWVLVCGAFLMGVEQSAYWTLWQTTLQQRVPADVLGRVSSYDWLGYHALGPLGYLLAPIIAAHFGPSAALFGGAAVVFTTVVTLLAMPEIRESRPQPVLADGM
ncbi:MAG: MFS transporter [Labedaea sp.]